MKISVWEYPAPDKLTCYFRGYVKIYRENTIERVPCPEVRKNKWKAKADAELLLKKLRNEKR